MNNNYPTLYKISKKAELDLPNLIDDPDSLSLLLSMQSEYPNYAGVPGYGYGYYGRPRMAQTGLASLLAGIAIGEARAKKQQEADKKKSKIIKAKQPQIKKALSIQETSYLYPSKALASTLGQLGNIANLGPVLTPKTMLNPDLSHEDYREFLDAARKHKNLKYTKLRLGGQDLIDDYIWRKTLTEEEEKEKRSKLKNIFKRLGGRAIHNPHAGLIYKLFDYYNLSPYSWLFPVMMRGSHYNPVTDTVNLYADEPALLQHELGHALDFNEPTIKGKKTFWKKHANKFLRDLYGLGYIPPLGNKLWYEAQANIKSRKLLEKVLKNKNKKLLRLLRNRDEILPAGFASYLGEPFAKFLPPVGKVAPAVGLLSGKLVGMLKSLKREQLERQEARAKKDKKKNKKKDEND